MKCDDRSANGSTPAILLVVFVIAMLSATPAAAQRVLEGGQPFALPGVASQVVVDDFNADGRLDIAMAGADTGVHAGALSVMLGDPETLLSARQTFHDVDVRSLASGDLNGDGLPDLMTVGSYVTVYINARDGSFENGRQLDVSSAIQVELSDLDEDGVLDAALSSPDGVHLLFGDGNGSFQRRSFVNVPGQLGGLSADDFDVDGHDDLVTASPRGIDWHRGRGDGTFDDPVTTVLPLVQTPRFLASGDLLRDGRPDLAIAGQDGAVFVLTNAGGGLFSEQFVGALPPFDVRAWDRGFFRIVDYDGNGLLDIIAPYGGPDSTVLRAYLGFGDGTFALELDVEMGVGLEWVELADLDGDTKLDAIVARSDLPEIVVFRGHGPADIETPVTVPVETGPRDLALADVNQDGAADVVLMSPSALSVVQSDGAGGFESSRMTDFADREFQSIIAADFGATGGAEVALADNARNEIVIVSFEGGDVAATIAHPVEESPIGLSAWDYDRDGLTDLAVVYRYQFELSVFLGPGIEGREPREVRVLVGGAGPRAIVTGDVDGDGAADLLVTTREGVSIHYGDGAGAFPRETLHNEFSNARWLELADIDGDGELDLMAAMSAGIVVVRQVGFPDRGAAERILLGEQVRGLEVVDFRGDGRLEAVTVTPTAVAVTPLPAEGGFGAIDRYTVGVGPRATAVGDLDGDGRLDLACANLDSRSLSVLRGAAVPAMRESLRRGDVDANGQVNLADAVVVLESLFGGAGDVSCPDAADADDDGRLTLTDPVRLLLFLFGGVAAPPAPGPTVCGPDPTPDALAACSLECL